MTDRELIELLAPLHERLRLRSPSTQEEIDTWGRARRALRMRASALETGAPRPLTAHLFWSGDPEVGIHGSSAEVTVDGLEVYEDVRESVREAFTALGEALEGEKPAVFFDDECLSCGKHECACSWPEEGGD